MKKIIYMSMMFLTAIAANAQTGVGTTTPQASLDVAGNPATTTVMDGIIAPRITAAQLSAKTYAAGQNGAMVYVTDAGTGTLQATAVSGIGLYTFDAVTLKWVKAGDGTGKDWSLTGNAGTTAGTNFIGTTDDRDIVFKRNNGVSGVLNDGFFNTSFGVNSLPLASTWGYNTAFGHSTLSSISDIGAINNVAVGYNALHANNSINNSALGSHSLEYNTTGTSNTGIGAGVLQRNTTGNGNTAVGFSALSVNTTGDNNTANGRFALNANTSAVNNTAVGFSALAFSTTGNYNTATGSNALYSNTTGANNTATGSNALYSNTTGANNTATGFGALSGNTTGAFNTAFGNIALGVNNIGNNNTAIGRNALGSNTSGIGNTAIGRNALNGNIAGTNNVALGNNAGGSINGDNNIAIGSNTSLSTSGSNQLNIGNQIFGTGLTGNLSSPAGNIGIGTAAPGSTMDVNGSLAVKYTSVNGATTSYSLLSTDFYVSYSGTANASFTLPAAISGTGNFKGRMYVIRNNTSFTITISPAGSETINGNTSVTVLANQSTELISTGLTGSASTWEIIR